MAFDDELDKLLGLEPTKKEFKFEYRGSDAQKILPKASDYFFFPNGMSPDYSQPTYTLVSRQRIQEAGIPDLDNSIEEEIGHFLPQNFEEVEPSVFTYDGADQFGINALKAIGMNEIATKPPNWP